MKWLEGTKRRLVDYMKYHLIGRTPSLFGPIALKALGDISVNSDQHLSLKLNEGRT